MNNEERRPRIMFEVTPAQQQLLKIMAFRASKSLRQFILDALIEVIPELQEAGNGTHSFAESLDRSIRGETNP